jgi:glycosyltransferase involved in cell wall biosynthesis
LSLRLTTYLYLERARLRQQPAHQVVAVSQPLANEICQEYPHLQSVLSVITPGVDIPEQIAMKIEARSAISTWADGQIILFVANDYARKGLATLLRALQGLPADVRLLVVGGTDSQTIQFSAKAKLLGIGERVQFLGPLLDMYPAYCAADVLAHPTLEDSFGMVVLEAMAHGLPVVVSGPQHCGISALLHDQHDALVLDDPQSAPGLCNALRALLSDESLINAITANALHFAQRHTWVQAAAAYEALYHRLVATEKTK